MGTGPDDKGASLDELTAPARAAAGEAEELERRRLFVGELAARLAAAAAGGPLALEELGEVRRHLAKLTRPEGAVKAAHQRIRAAAEEPLVADWLGTKPEPLPWALAVSGGRYGEPPVVPVMVPVMVRGVVGLLASRGGVGKTTVALELAVLAAGGEGGPLWLGVYDVAPGKVLYVNGEDSKEGLHRRVWATVTRLERLVQNEGEREAWRARVVARLVVVPLAGCVDAALVSVDAAGDAAETETTRALREVLDASEEPWALVVLDPLARFAHGETETDQAVATRTIAAAEQLTQAPGRPSVLLTHHARKGGDGSADDIRGASALFDAARWAMTLARQGEYDGAPELVTLRHVKANDCARDKPRALARGEGGALALATEPELKSWQAAEAAAKEAAKPAKRGAAKGGGAKAIDPSVFK